MTNSTSPTTGPGSQLGTKSRAILELLRKGRARNRLDIEMLLGYECRKTISRLIGMRYLKNGGTLGANSGLYEITNAGREALGEALTLKTPMHAPHCAATMRAPYIPSVHGVSRVGLARS